MLTGRRNNAEGVLTSSHLTEMYRHVKDGRRTIVHRLKSRFAYNEACREAFGEDVALGRELEHPNLWGYTGEDADGADGTAPGCVMEPLNCMTLESYLKENPAFVAESAELERIVNEVTDAVAYLHGQGVCHLDLHPRNILLTRGGHQVKLANLFSPYVHLTGTLSLENDGFVAPECFAKEPLADPIRSDIYSLGCFISYLYDMASLPYRYRRMVQRARSTDPARRPSCIRAFRNGVAQDRVLLRVVKGFMWVVLTLLATWGLFSLTTSSEGDEIHFVQPTADNTYVYDSITGQEYYLNDSAMAVREAMIEHQKEKMMKEYDQKVNDIFKKTFRQKAEPIIKEIYSEEQRHGNVETVKSRRGRKQLIEIQEELAEQYGNLDPVTTANMAASVIDELIRQQEKE